MARFRSAALLALSALAFAALLQGCGKKEAAERRGLIKSTLAPGADVGHPRPISFQDLASMPEPPGIQVKDPRYESNRIPAFPNPLGLKEGDIVSVRAWLQMVTFASDEDFNLRFTATPGSRDHYLTSEIPDEDDVTDPALLKMVDAARTNVKNTFLGGHDPSRQGTMLAEPVYVEITGQLFFSDARIGTPAPDKQGLTRASYWQVHPVLSVTVLPKPAQ